MLQKSVLAVFAALCAVCSASETPCQQEREDATCQANAPHNDSEHEEEEVGLLQAHVHARGQPPRGCKLATFMANYWFVCEGCVWVPSAHYEDSVLKQPLTEAEVMNYGNDALFWAPDLYWVTKSRASGQTYHHFANFGATAVPTSDDSQYARAGKLTCSTDPADKKDRVYIRNVSLKGLGSYPLFLDQDTRTRAEENVRDKIQDCYNGLEYYIMKKIFESLLDGLAKDAEVQSKVDLMFSMLSLPLMFVPGLGLPAGEAFAATVAGQMGKRIGEWANEAGNVRDIVNFAVDRQHANINQALSFAQDQAKAAIAIGDLLIHTYTKYTIPIKESIGKLSNQDVVFFNWKFSTSESAHSHCSNKSIVKLVDDGYNTLMKMKTIGWSKHAIGLRKWKQVVGVRPCDPFDAWCYCSYVVDRPDQFSFGEKVPKTYESMVLNYTNKMDKIGKWYVKTRDVDVR